MFKGHPSGCPLFLWLDVGKTRDYNGLKLLFDFIGGLSNCMNTITQDPYKSCKKIYSFSLTVMLNG